MENHWDRRVGRANDPNIKSWNLYYAGQDEAGLGPGRSEVGSSTHRNPVLDEKVDLKEAVQAGHLKLEIARLSPVRW